jgi:phosphoglycolate phosphatase-like HAD superfamily hydrolase
MSADELASWRETTAKQSIAEFVAAVTDPDSPDFVPERDRVAVFDNDGTLWTEQPVYAQLIFALDRAAELGHPTSLEELHAGGMAALMKLLALTHASITTDEFDAACRSWLASARHPRFGRPYPATVYQPMLELLSLLDRHGFSCWIFSGGGTDFMRTWTADVYGLPPHRVIGSVGGTDFRVGDGGPELVKNATVQVLDDGPQKPSSIHRHVGQRPILAAGNTDGDLAMLQWTAASPHRTLELVVHHTDGDREYAYDQDPILGSGTGQILAAAAEHKWNVIDMAADWATIQIVNDGPQKPISIHRHVGQRPILAAGNTDGDLAMLEWAAASPHRTLELIVHHTDGVREYAYERDPILGAGTEQIQAAATKHNWTVIDMAADWSTVHPPAP